MNGCDKKQWNFLRCGRDDIPSPLFPSFGFRTCSQSKQGLFKGFGTLSQQAIMANIYMLALLAKLLESGEINHSESGENRQFQSNENRQSRVASPGIM